ncbi:Na+/H+ antiporter NhaA [Polymorphospora lycopeni]|uniref:Na(+)/H(+) antiporter NhaA n=1 Tax=Polymorphospora lycopeni TaxID=3140240 RepID=A0ABV5CJF7_9ACTN
MGADPAAWGVAASGHERLVVVLGYERAWRDRRLPAGRRAACVSALDRPARVRASPVPLSGSRASSLGWSSEFAAWPPVALLEGFHVVFPGTVRRAAIPHPAAGGFMSVDDPGLGAPRPSNGLLGRTARALRQDTVGGMLLVVFAVIALGWANSPWASAYEALRAVTFGPASLHLDLPAHAWAADGLLAVFFFVVGNELKQEFVNGELRNPRRAVLPIVAAVGGVAVPALIFAAITAGHGDAAAGWGIPMATDIAFAVAVLAVVGRGLPPSLRTFLLTLAIVDDLVAIIVIAVFYSAGLAWAPLLGSIVLLVVFGWLQSGRGPARRLWTGPVPAWVVIVPLAVVIWAVMHASGVHATIAGAAMGLLMRTTTFPGEMSDPSHRAEHVLRPWTAGLVLPVFAFFAAGVAFTGAESLATDRVAIAVFVGLVVGKVVGITGGAWLTTKVSRAELNPQLGWLDIVGMAMLAGIGFTVSLLIAELSYPGNERMLDHAKGAVLIASATAAVLASVVLPLRGIHHRRRRAT